MKTVADRQPPEPIGVRLKRLRLKKGFSTGEVSRQLGVSPSTYREWEYGRSIRGEPYEKLAAILGVSLHELLLGERGAASEARKWVAQIEKDLQALKSEIMKIL